MTNRKWGYPQYGTYSLAMDSTDKMPAGAYRCNHSDRYGYILQAHQIITDNLLILPDPVQDNILKEFDRFWDIADRFHDYGFLHKRGLLLWGPPGSGKTTTMNLLSQKIIKERDGIVVIAHEGANLTAECLRLIRVHEPTRQILLMIEDMDTVTHGSNAQEWLNVMDGNVQIDGLMYLATTNYPERLDMRFLDRPSRFDTILKMDMPGIEARKAYLEAKVPSLSEGEIQSWASKTEGFSLAHMKELIIAVKCLGQTVSQAVERMERLKQSPPDSGMMGRDNLRAPRGPTISYQAPGNGQATLTVAAEDQAEDDLSF